MVFLFAIKKFDLKTPGREDDNLEAEKKVEKLSKDKNFSDQKAQQEILTTLYTYIRDSKEEKEQTVTISLQQNDGVWIVKKENQELEKALLANGEELIQLIQ